MVEKLWRYVKPFSYNTSVSRTDRQTDRRMDRRTDGRTELLYQYRASAAVCWRAIKTFHFNPQFWKVYPNSNVIRYTYGISTLCVSRGPQNLYGRDGHFRVTFQTGTYFQSPWYNQRKMQRLIIDCDPDLHTVQQTLHHGDKFISIFSIYFHFIPMIQSFLSESSTL